MRSKRFTKITTVIVLMCFILQLSGLQNQASGETLKKHIQIIMGQSIMLKVDGVIKRVSLGNPSISDYSVISKNEVMVLASKVGRTELYLWLKDDTKLVYNLIVYDDLADLRTKLLQVLGPKAAKKVKLVLAKETVILKGVVSSQYEAKQAEDVAGLYYKVMNLLEVKKDEPKIEKIAEGKLTPEETARLSMEEKYRKASDKTSRIFKLRHADATQTKTIFTKMLSQDGYLEVDTRTNSLIVVDKPSIVQRMSAFLNVLDETEPQVVIEAKVIEVTLGNNMSSAFDWIYETLYSGTNTLDNKLNNKAVTLKSGQLDLNLDYGNISNDHFTAQILPRLSESESRLVSNPTTVTMNRKEAKIEINDKIPYITFTPQGSTGTLVPQPETLDAGITLSVTPTVLDKGDVRMDLKLSVSSFIENVDFGQYGTVPRTFDKTSSNIVTVSNNHTLVVGGLIKDDLKTTDVKVPWLGKLPVLKNMFRSNKNEKSRTELLIFVTPKVIYPNKTNLAFNTANYIDIGKAEMTYDAEMTSRHDNMKKKFKEKYPESVPHINEVKEESRIKVISSEKNMKEIPSLAEKVAKRKVVVLKKTVAETVKNTEKTFPVAKKSVNRQVSKKVSREIDSKPLRSAEAKSLISELKNSYKSSQTREISKKVTVKKRKPAKKITIVKKQKPAAKKVSVIKKAAKKSVIAAKPAVKEYSSGKKALKTELRSKEAFRLLAELKSNKVKKVSSSKTLKSFSSNKNLNISKNNKVVVKKINSESLKLKTKPAAEKVVKTDLISKSKLEKLAKKEFMKKIKELKISKTDLKERMSAKEKMNVLKSLKSKMTARLTAGGEEL